MKKNLFFTLFIVHTTSCIVHCFAQNPLVKKWDYRYGGGSFESVSDLQQTPDGGYILGGVATSGISGNKTSMAYGDGDYWVVKLDSSGIMQWENDFGGSGFEEMKSLVQTNDGGYLLAGYSSSGISPVKTQGAWNGSPDYWIVKIDAAGNRLWDKVFGGTEGDYLSKAEQTSDGGFILGGYSYSGISGDKTQNSHGLPGNDADYWIVKTDSLGNKQWDKDFGGTGYDWQTEILQTADGGYLCGGYSESDSSGDKSQNNLGARDCWIIKTDANGIKQWDQSYGSASDEFLASMIMVNNNKFILGNTAYSAIGYSDYWMITIDSLGQVSGSEFFGGSDTEELLSITSDGAGNILLSGDSYSPVSADKTESNMGFEQTWFLKSDSLGNRIWDKTVLSNGHDENGITLQTQDGCYVSANTSAASIGGYKTQDAWNSSNDFWVVKFCDTIAIPVAILSAPVHICPGTCIDLVNNSVNATSFQWILPGGSPSTSTDVVPNICYNNPGGYPVTLIASGQNGIDTLTLNNFITVYPYPLPQGISQSGDTLFAIAGATAYQWYLNVTLISGATNYFYVATMSGDYNVVATDINGCEVEAAIFNVIAGLSPGLSKGEGVFVSPNSVDRELEIKNSELRIQAAGISIFNLMGERIQAHIQKYDQGLKVNCEHLPPGIYFLEIAAEGKLNRIRFVK